MKKLIFSLAVFAVVTTSKAAVITVSNNPNSPGQYTNLQTAADAALANDTLYVHGSGIDYGTVTITKPLTIIGAGALPNKNLALETLISVIIFTYTNNNSSNASGSCLYGCKISGRIELGNNTISTIGIGNITIVKNKLKEIRFKLNSVIYNNYKIENNVIENLGYDPGYTNSIQLNNSIVKNNIIESVYGFGKYGSSNWIFSNNIVLAYFKNNSATIVSNNIFYMSASNFSSNTYSTFNNNIFFSSTTTYSSTLFTTNQNSGSGNILNQDPGFEYYAESGSTSIFDYSYTSPTATSLFVNFNLSAGSPGKSYGTDGTDVGIYGGVTPYIEGTPSNSRFRYFPMPLIPQVLDVTILNSSLPQNATLNVNIKARK
jgi:hypothetical protein